MLREVLLVQPEHRSRSWVFLVVGILVVLVVGGFWFFRRPKLVAVTHPQRVSLTETIASSARVGGVQESAVGAQFTGTVQRLLVKIGDRVKAGQTIAILKNDVTQLQTAQANIAVQTARARLAQASRKPLPSEIHEATAQVTEANAQVRQMQTDLQLATTQFERSRQMYEHQLISKNEFDNAESTRDSLRAKLQAARATVKVREAKVETLENTPRAEDVQIARAQLAEAEQALQVATQQSRDATVVAPYDGVITKLNAEEGQTVGASGVVNIVSDDLEIRVDLDENNLADLELGQTAVLSAQAFGDKTFRAKLTDIGAAVDEARGIVTIKLTPIDPPAWLRPGQTVNVNLLTNEKVERLLVPSTAVLRQGSRSVVLLAQDGRAVERPVITRPAVAEGIPIASGLMESDEVVVDAINLSAGQAIRVKAAKP